MPQGGKKEKKASSTLVENVLTFLCLVFCGAVCALAKGLAGPAPDWAIKMTNLQHPVGQGRFRAGVDDLYSIAFAVALLTVCRKVAMKLVAAPLALILRCGPDNVQKFEQQAWVFVYYCMAFSWGLSECYGSPYWFNTAELYRGVPQNMDMSASFKLYYLFQMAFWFHMVFVTLVEPWQKDFVVMILHHVVTISMLQGAYWLGFLRMGNAILTEQDFADIFLPIAKMCNYIGMGQAKMKGSFQMMADILFASFAIVWIPTRHGILPWIYYSIFVEARTELTGNCNCGHGTRCVWAPERMCFFTEENADMIILGYKVFLGFFQILLCIWLKDLLTAVYKAIAGGGVVKGNVEADSSQGTLEGKKKKS
eukprot:gnl/TRDRNA2_/TRDRNA2_186476_c0_seq1.p1 gnl/TRDRNA2_/TRDRNA2_186476_c0~~gnl/TRDRNA2_/TRDRNA2_186476_c0_seq1.p1  ORF type:complete len:366 (+),score=69.87 gnl/TRDRNA2_/TRDRNA2_186476_c0_seq1:119-1216(+)